MTAAQQLPAGRRRAGTLTARQVAAHQRRRILAAMIRTVADKGFPATTVADVIAVAGVSRATFYEQFADLRDCFLAAFDSASDHVRAALQEQAPNDVEQLVDIYLETLAADVAAARVFLVDVYALGADGVRRRAASQQRFARAVAGLVGARTAAERFACEAYVAAVAMLVTARVAGADAEADRAAVLALRAPLSRLAATMIASR